MSKLISRRVKIAIFFCAFSFAQSLSYGAVGRIYSNVEYNEEGGDLLGYELEFHVDRMRISGVLRIYEGGCGNAAAVDGTLDRNKITLNGVSEIYGKLNLTGTLSNGLIQATLVMQKATKPETVKLRRISKPHC